MQLILMLVEKGTMGANVEYLYSSDNLHVTQLRNTSSTKISGSEFSPLLARGEFVDNFLLRPMLVSHSLTLL